MSKPVTPLLDAIASPADLRALPESDLAKVAEELRAETISAVSVTGGHLGAGLGVIELTVALHYVFDTPRDRLIWDVGHQAYPHKILTGRRSRIRTLRQGAGLSGFTKRAESEYDAFGAGHSSTSISAGLGMAVARDLSHAKTNVVAVIGDGAMSAGMAYEAMNNAGAMGSRLIVILNDNDMSIAPPTGAMSSYLARLVTSHTYRSFRDVAKQLAKRLPKFLYDKARRTEEFGRGFWTGGTLFEELGFYYVGPIDGHNLDHLLPILKNVRDMHGGPVLVHVVTKKGKGYPPAEAADDKYHGVSAFDVITGAQAKPKSNAPAYTKVFGEALLAAARSDEKIVAVTAAMPQGTGVDIMAEVFPERVFDVGIAEQHAVTFAAGLAAEGFKPFCAIYSTFLQRAYDQVVHDVAVQNLPVRFAIDRAGLVGADGATHAGAFDVAVARLPAQHGRDGGGGRGRAHPHGRDRGRLRLRPDRAPLSARRRRRRRDAGARRSPADRQGPDRARRLAHRDPDARNPARGGAEGGRGARRPRALDHGRRRAVRKAPRPRAHSRPRRRSMSS